jgi:hypothetical protein
MRAGRRCARWVEGLVGKLDCMGLRIASAMVAGRPRAPHWLWMPLMMHGQCVHLLLGQSCCTLPQLELVGAPVALP